MIIYCMGDFGDYSKSVSDITKQIKEDYSNSKKRKRGRPKKKNDDAILALCGDNFYDRGVDHYDHPYWEKYKEAFSDMPFEVYAVLGNHDYLSDVHGQIGSPHWNMPAPYYFVKAGNCGLWFIDTQILAPEEDGGEYHDMRDHIDKYFGDWRAEKRKHWEWLEKSLKANRKLLYKFVFGHFPIVSCGAYDGRDGMWPLATLLDKYDVTAYISGHDHNSQHSTIIRDDFLIQQYICGATIKHGTYECENARERENIENSFFTTKLSFLKIEIDEEEEECTICFLNRKGDLLYERCYEYVDRKK